MTHYNIQGSQDPNTGKITLFCTDPIGSCLRSRCECDRDLAQKLAFYEDEWNQMNHHKWSQPLFNRQGLVEGPRLKSTHLRQQVCNDPGAAVSTSYLQAKQDGTFQVVNPYLNSQFNAVQNSQVNSAPGKNYNQRQQGETNSLNLNVRFINREFINREPTLDICLGFERVYFIACPTAV